MAHPLGFRGTLGKRAQRLRSNGGTAPAAQAMGGEAGMAADTGGEDSVAALTSFGSVPNLESRKAPVPIAVSPTIRRHPSRTENSAIGRVIPGATNSKAPARKNTATSRDPATIGQTSPRPPRGRPTSLEPRTYEPARKPA